MKLLAIDPGLKGGLAVFDDVLLVAVAPMPLWKTQLTAGSKPRKQVDVQALHRIIRQHDIEEIVTEYQTAMPGQSSVGTATSFLNWGLVLSLRGLAPVHVVHPRSWKKHYGLGNDKQAAIAHARKLLGLPIDSLTTDGEAEAALIGKYWINWGSERERASLQLQKSRPKRRKRKAKPAPALKRKAGRPSASSPAPASSPPART